MVMRLKTALVAASIATVVTGSASASGVDPTRISLPKGPGSIEGLGRSFSPSLSSGTASYGVTIAVPPGVNGFVPELSLDYDSGGGVSDVGLGWSISKLPKIRRRTDNGLPRFTDADPFEITGMGIPSDLLEVSPGVFRPQYESGSFVRVKRSADGKTWEARDKSGTTYRFGGDGYVEAEGDHVAAYLLHEAVDLFGHKITYAWDATSAGHGVLASVVYNDFSATARNEVVFTYETRPDAHTRFGSGIKETVDRRLTKLEVKHGGALVRRYDLTYVTGGHSRLASVTMVGSDGVTSLPTLSLQYAEASLASDGQITTMITPPGRSPSDTNVDLADLDGDGLPDLLVTKAGAFRSYINHNGVKWNAGQDWASSPSVELGSTGVQLADVDGDGAIDLLVKSGVASLRYFPGATATSFATSIPFARSPNFTFEDPDVRLADMDGDRRTDVAITTAAGLAIGYNLNGTDWTTPTTIGEIDPKQPLRFSDGHTQLCDVNGDRVQDFCYLRPGSLVYWLGRGRGAFEPAVTATGVPDFDPTAPFQLSDLDGDGWTDMVRVGVTQVEYALATGAGTFAPVKSIGGVPTKGPNTTVRFADMNGSGTSDIVWIDVSGSPDQAWKYLELFPNGRGGLLRTIDNGLGKRVSIAYASSALEAAAARDAGKPWTTRMNVSMPVVKRVEIDAGLGDPVMATEYSYRDGTYAPEERTFAAFGGGTDRQIGDAYAPTLLSIETFDAGLTDRTQRGLQLTSESRDEKGYVFSRGTRTYTTKAIAKATDGRSITYTFLSAEQVEHIEGTDSSKARTTQSEWEQDEYGNVTAERRWGEVVAGNKLAGNDEAFSFRTYANDTNEWVLGRIATDELQDGAGTRVRMQRTYYDGEAFTGLPLGQVTRGLLSRKEGWLGPDASQFVLIAGMAYDADGNPTESKDAIGGGRTFAWNADNRTFVDSESLKTGAQQLSALASYDARFGTLLAYTAYNGQVSSYGYDALGRLVSIVFPGDSAERPTERYSYQLGAPVSRVTSDARIWSGRDDVEHREQVYDGLGRARATFINDDDGRIVLEGIGFFDARGSVRRSLRERFASDSERATPPLGGDGPGDEAWRDASGRTIRTRSQLGIESRHSFEPFVTKSWDGAQTDPASAYEHTPVVEVVDGRGRLVAKSQTLGGVAVTTSITSNAAGEMLSRVDPEGHASQYRYDGLGRRTSIVDADLGRHSFVYDAVGNQLEHHKPGGVITRATYDLASRILTEDWDGDGTAEVTRSWDVDAANVADPNARGQLAGATWPGGATRYTYDERGRATDATISANGTSYTLGARYDAQDREYLHVYPDASSVRIRRSARGLIAGYGKAVTFAYDADARETQREFNTGVMELQGYDDDRRRTETIAKRGDGSEIQHLRWTFDASSNLRSVTDLRTGIDAAHDRSETYGYDNLYRLTSAKGTWGQTTWKFSPSGNLIDRTSSEASQYAGPMTYGIGAGPHALTGFKGRTIAYDPRGRMTDDGDRKYTWDDGEHLTRVVAKNGARVDSTFDHAGARRLRVEKSAAGGSQTTIFLDAWSEVRDGKLLRYIVHGGQRIARLSERNGVPSAAGTSSGALSEEPPGARSAGVQHGATAGAVALRLGLQATTLSLTLSLFAALISFYRRALARMARYSLPLVGFAVICILAACKGSDNEAPKAPPVEDGTVQTLGEDDQLLFDDQIGTLTETTSGSGVAQASSATYAFGLTRYDTSGETRKYANTPRDVGVGLDQMGARSYAPELGVWTSGDPVALSAPSRQADAADIGGGNAYAYAAGRPLTHVDRDGHFPSAAAIFNPIIFLDAAVIMGAVVVTVSAVDFVRTHPITISPPAASGNLMEGIGGRIATVSAASTANKRECTEASPSPSNGSGNRGSAAGGSAAAPAAGQQAPAQQGQPPRGSNNPNTRSAAGNGSRYHADKPGRLPDQLRDKYPETKFKFTKPGQKGQDVKVDGGKHPSGYPDSKWPKDVDHGDFKPDTKGGKKTFDADQKSKWKEPTTMLPYDPGCGKLK
jgi:RHS repeat-associated protein